MAISDGGGRSMTAEERETFRALDWLGLSEPERGAVSTSQLVASKPATLAEAVLLFPPILPVKPEMVGTAKSFFEEVFGWKSTPARAGSCVIEAAYSGRFQLVDVNDLDRPWLCLATLPVGVFDVETTVNQIGRWCASRRLSITANGLSRSSGILRATGDWKVTLPWVLGRPMIITQMSWDLWMPQILKAVARNETLEIDLPESEFRSLRENDLAPLKRWLEPDVVARLELLRGDPHAAQPNPGRHYLLLNRVYGLP